MLKNENNNYFEIEEPDSYICKMSVYTSGYRILYLQVWKSGNIDSKFYIAFENVIYFSGVPLWRGGARFRLGTVEEINHILKSLNQTFNPTEYKLFVAETEDAMIKIIARDANIDTEGHPPIEN